MFANSKILNPDMEGAGGTVVKNHNYYQLLSFLFDAIGIDTSEINFNELDDLQLVNYLDSDGIFNKDVGGQVIFNAENGFFVNFLAVLGRSGALESLASMSSASESEIVKILTKINFDELFFRISESAIMTS